MGSGSPQIPQNWGFLVILAILMGVLVYLFNIWYMFGIFVIPGVLRNHFTKFSNHKEDQKASKIGDFFWMFRILKGILTYLFNRWYIFGFFLIPGVLKNDFPNFFVTNRVSKKPKSPKIGDFWQFLAFLRGFHHTYLTYDTFLDSLWPQECSGMIFSDFCN